MFAVIKTGGKQYKVAKDDMLIVERLSAEAGETVQFNDVLMLGGDSMKIGAPLVDGAGVQAEVLEQGRGEKLLNLKRRRRKHSSRRLKGHRQYLTTVKVTEILTSGADASGIKAAVGAAVGGAPSLSKVAVAEPAQAEAPADAAVIEEAAPVEAVTETPAVEEAAPAEVVAEAPAAEDAEPVESERPENLLTEAQGEPDDLTRISGVGPKLLQKLNDNGVFHFWQIAAWGASEIAYMDDQLSFKGRIERDNWIGQATTFADETKEG